MAGVLNLLNMGHGANILQGAISTEDWTGVIYLLKMEKVC